MCVCVDDSYSVPLDVEIDVEVKPRSLSGVILSVFSHGAGPPGGDFLVLQLVNGQVSTTPVQSIAVQHYYYYYYYYYYTVGHKKHH